MFFSHMVKYPIFFKRLYFMPHPFNYFNEEQSEQYVADTVRLFEDELRQKIPTWLASSTLDSSAFVTSIIAHALQIDEACMFVITPVLEDVLHVKELDLEQTCAAHHLASRGDAIEKSSDAPDYHDDLKRNRVAFYTLCERIISELCTTSYAIYLDALEAKLRDATLSDTVRALSGMLLNLRAHGAVNQEIVKLQLEKNRYEQSSYDYRVRARVTYARKEKIGAVLGQIQVSEQCIEKELLQVQQDLSELFAKRVSCRRLMLGFALFAVISTVSAMMIGLPIMSVVAGCVIALHALITGFTYGEDVNINIVKNQGREVFLTGEKKSLVKSISSYICIKALEERFHEWYQTRVRVGDKRRQEITQYLMSRAKTRDGFFMKAKEQGNAIVASYVCVV